MARPRKYTQKFKRELLNEFREYVKNNDFPSVAGFASIKMIPKTNFYDWGDEKGFEEFSTLIKICNDKQEAWAFQAGVSGRIKATFPIFVLKNHGYTDRQDINQNVSGKIEGEFTIQSKSQLLEILQEAEEEIEEGGEDECPNDPRN